ncbi:MAG: MFS transporter [Actinomycetota bacterium]|nr:MFS transporter [Actinomycetota bacterium]
MAAAVDATTLPIRRNTALLSAAMAVNSAVLQLIAAVSSITFVAVTGIEGLLGLGPAIFLTAQALTALPAGRAMDAFGRIPVIATGFALGTVGCLLTAAGAAASSAVLVVGGFALLGASGGIALLIRTAAGDMYPEPRRARGIALVLFGAVFGAILGPSVFTPLFADRELEARALAVPWLAAAVLPLVALALVLLVRPDPKRIAELLPDEPSAPDEPGALLELVRRPRVVPAMLAAIASLAVMVAVMNLTGYVVVDHHHHHEHSVFPIIGAHVLGMFAFVLVIGSLIDRVGRAPALAAGLVVMGLSCLGLIWFAGVPMTAFLLFGLGVGWNLSFVAATAQLADATAPGERGRLLGLNDLLSSLTGAGLALLGGFVLNALGVVALAAGAAALVLLPLVWVARRREFRRAVPKTA